MITIPEWLVGVGVTVLSGMIAMLIRNAVQHARNEASAKAGKAIAQEAKLAATDAMRLAAELEREFALYREKVAQEYASVELINRLEGRLVAGLDRIGARFDQFMLQNGKAS